MSAREQIEKESVLMYGTSGLCMTAAIRVIERKDAEIEQQAVGIRELERRWSEARQDAEASERQRDRRDRLDRFLQKYGGNDIDTAAAIRNAERLIAAIDAAVAKRGGGE